MLKEVSKVDSKEEIILNKIGLNKTKAKFCIKISKKYSLWIATQIKKDNKLIDKESEFRIILDWKKSHSNLNLNDYDFKQALEASEKYHKEAFLITDNSLKNNKVVCDLDEYKWVQLKTKADCIEEGLAMGHCIGSSHGHIQKIESGSCTAYSLRDKFNKPHITLEIELRDKAIVEFKGKQNCAPDNKYAGYVVGFLLNNKEWEHINDNKFWETLGHSKVLARELAKKFPKLFDLKKRIIYDVEIRKEDLFVNGDLNLSNTPLEVLPDDLTVTGNLFIDNTKIIKLGKNLKVGNKLSMKKTLVKELPIDLEVGEIIEAQGSQILIIHKENLKNLLCLDLSETPLEIIPDNFTIKGELKISNTKVKVLPNMEVGSVFYATGLEIESVHNGLKLGAAILMGNCKIGKFELTNVKGSLDLNNTKLPSLPDNMNVKVSLYVKGSSLKKLPLNLTVGTNIVFSNTKINEIPKCMKVKDKIYIPEGVNEEHLSRQMIG